MDYIALIRKAEGTDYGVDFPDFPGCVSSGETLDEARAAAAEALALHVHGMAQDGEALPEPSSLQDIMRDPENREAVAVLVPVEAPSRAVRINVTIAEDALKRIDAYAAAHSLSRSAFLAQAALRAIQRAG
jgi:predicted RNase H-like HicB family nuclease